MRGKPAGPANQRLTDETVAMCMRACAHIRACVWACVCVCACVPVGAGCVGWVVNVCVGGWLDRMEPAARSSSTDRPSGAHHRRAASCAETEHGKLAHRVGRASAPSSLSFLASTPKKVQTMQFPAARRSGFVETLGTLKTAGAGWTDARKSTAWTSGGGRQVVRRRVHVL